MPSSASRELAVRLVVDNTDAVRRQFQEVGDTADRELGRVGVAARRGDEGLGGLASRATLARGAMVAFGTAVGVVAGVAGLGLVARQAVESTAELARMAEMAGFSAAALQELTFASSRFQVSQDALVDGLKELNLRADEFAKTGAGSAAESFQRLGLSTSDVNSLLADSDELLREVIRRMEGLGTAARIRISDELFGGTGGEQFIGFLAAGAEAIDRMREEARRLGIVISDELIASAREAEGQISTLNQVLDAQLNKSLVALAPLISDIAAGLTRMAVGAGQAYESLRDNLGNPARIRELHDEIAGINRELERRESQLDRRRGKNPNRDENLQSIIADLRAELALREAELRRLGGAGGRLGVAVDVPEHSAVPARPPVPVGLGDFQLAPSLRGVGERVREPARRQAALRDYVEQLERERDLAGLTTRERQEQRALLEAAARAGRDLSDAEEARIVSIVRAGQARADELDRVRRIESAFEGAAETIGGSLLDVVGDSLRGVERQGVSTADRLRDAFTDAAAEIGEALILDVGKGLLTGGAPTAAGGAFGGLFGGSSGGGLGSSLLSTGISTAANTIFGTAGGIGGVFSGIGASLFGTAGTAGSIAAAGTVGGIGAGSAATAGLLGTAPALAAAVPYLAPLVIGGALLAGGSLFGKESVGPNAAARLGIRNGRFQITATGADNDGNPAAASAEARRAAELINDLLSRSGATAIDIDSAADLAIRDFQKRGGLQRSAEDLVSEILQFGQFGGNTELIETARREGLEAALEQADAALEQARAAERAAQSLDSLSAQLERGKDGLRSLFAGVIEPLESFGASAAFGDLSTASPGERLALAQGRFANVLASARGGDLAALRALPGIGSETIEIARENFASSPEFVQIQQGVASSIAGVLEGVRAQQAASLAEFGVPIVETLQQQTATLRAEIASMSDEIRRLNDLIARAA